MKPWVRKTILLLFAGLILWQFYQPKRNVKVEQDLSKDFATVNHAPEDIKNLLKNSCYDCHSNNTEYRWYDLIQPARMIVERHIDNGKKELNFNEWTDYSARRQASKLDRMIKNIEKGVMPLKSYTLIHQSAKLNEAQKQALVHWLNGIKTSG